MENPVDWESSAVGRNTRGFISMTIISPPRGFTPLRRAIELDPSDPDAHYDLGIELLQANQLEAAAAEFQTTVKLTPDSAQAHSNLGIALASMGRVDDAIAHFREAIRIDPAFPEARKNLDIALAQKKGAGR